MKNSGTEDMHKFPESYASEATSGFLKRVVPILFAVGIIYFPAFLGKAELNAIKQVQFNHFGFRRAHHPFLALLTPGRDRSQHLYPNHITRLITFKASVAKSNG